MPAPPRVHYLQHADHEGLGAIGPWLARRGAPVRRSCLHLGEPLPRPADFDWLIVMGGPMNIYEHDRHPWLVAEKSLINDACVTNKKVLGICLGAQLLADVLGGPTTRNPEPEIGWFEVTLTEEGSKSALFGSFPNSFRVLHWHGDTFAPPPGSPSLLCSAACPNQAFERDGGRMLGLQFHLEVRPQDLSQWLDEDLPAPSRTVQAAADLRRDAPACAARTEPLLHRLLERMDAR